MSVQLFAIDEFNRMHPHVIDMQYINATTITRVAYIPSDTQLKEPLVISNLSMHQALIVIGSHASVVLRDERNGMQDKKIYCYIKQHASVQLQCMYTRETAYGAAHIVCIAEEDATCTINLLFMNAIKSAYTITCIAAGINAHMRVRGAYLVKEQEHIQIDSYQTHYAAHTTSTIDMRGIISNTGNSQFNGLIFIDEKAQHANASQTNKNILLGAQAQAQSIPAIEVLTNDVQCSHGSAIGQLDAEQLWYMQSRGICYKDATRILLQGFLSDIFSDKEIIAASLSFLSQMH